MSGLSNQERVISKVMVDGEIRPLLDRGVDPEWFPEGNSRDAITFILDHYDKYGLIPTPVTFRKHMGTKIKLVSVSESMEYLLDELARSNRWRVLRAGQPDVLDALDKDRDPEAALALIADLVAQAGRFQPNTTRVVDSMHPDRIDERLEDYKRREKGSAILGLTTGFPTIDETTLGLQPGHLVTVLAQPKVGKTSLCLAIGNHVFRQGKRVLFASFEMGIREMELRQESLMAGISFKNLQSGDLTKLEKKKYLTYSDWAADFDNEFYFMDASSGSTISSMRAQIERLEPDLVILDGIYMMHDEITGESNTPQSLTNITRALKRLATQSGLPIVINTQALAWKSKGQKISMDSAGYSSSFAQDSDVVLGLEKMQVPKDEDESSYAYQRFLRILASRNTGLAQVELAFDYAEGRIEEME